MHTLDRPFTNVRNLAETRELVLQKAIKHTLSGLIRQYGIDDLLIGLNNTYRDQVFSRAKSSEPVQHRAALLDEMVERLEKGVLREAV